MTTTVADALKAYKAAVAEQARLLAAYNADSTKDLLDAYNDSCTAVTKARDVLGRAREAVAPPLVNDGWDVADQHLDD